MRLIIFLTALSVIYWLSRLINLTHLPIFTDEAIYLRWAQIALHDPNFRFISLTDGKQPSFIWLVMIMMNFIKDPLIAGRLVSAIAGFFGMVGMWFLGWYLFRSKAIGFWAAFFYLISPFFLLYDRLALYDSLAAAFTIWSLFLSVLLVRTMRLDVALVLGMVLGGGILTKSSAFFNIALLPTTLLLFNWKKFSPKRFFLFSGLVILSASGALVMYNALRLSPWFYIIERKNAEFVYSLSDIIRNPFQYFLPNLNGLTTWLIGYVTIPLAILTVGGFFFGKKYLRERVFLLIAFLAPYLYLAFFGKVLFPRFLLFMTIPLYLLAAKMLVQLEEIVNKRSLLLLISYFLLLVYPIYFDYTILFNPIKAPLPTTDRNQYLDDWPAGFGVSEAVEFINGRKNNQQIFLATEGTFGLFPAAFELYFWDDESVETKGYWPMTEDIIGGELIDKAKEKETYLVFKETEKVPADWPLRLVLQIPRGKGETYLRMYQVLVDK